MSTFAPSPPVVLTIAGSDCSGGAGIQADLKTFTALGCFGLTALTSVVAENPAEVRSVRLMDAAMIRDQIDVLVESFPIAAAKCGMLGGKEQITAVVTAWQALAAKGIPLVVDPVMVATSGGRLLEDDAVEELTERLLPLAAIITPNLDEAGVLMGIRVSERLEMEACASELARRYGCAVLLKGGHLRDEAPDLLLAAGEYLWLEGDHIPGVHTHGTGCTLSAAITAGLARGLSLPEAVQAAKKYTTEAIATHYRWDTVDALSTRWQD